MKNQSMAYSPPVEPSQTGQGILWTLPPGKDVPAVTKRPDAPTLADYERLLIARYIGGGHTGETASRFARGEIAAIRSGSHWTHGKPAPPDPQALILAALSPDDRERFTERAGILEYDAGLSRVEAESRALRKILARSCPAPEKPAYRGRAALRRTLAAGVPLKDFYAKSRDNDPATYTADIQEIAAVWKQGVRRFKALVRGRFLVLDIGRKPGKPDGLEIFYKIFPHETMLEALQDILGGSFPCYVATPSGGFHLYFRYDGFGLKLRELAPAIDVIEWQITAPGSEKENGAYVLHGNLADAPPLYGVILERIEKVKRERERGKAARLVGRQRTPTAADRPVRFDKPRITLDDLSGEAASAYAGHHDRQVCFAGKACRCKFSPAETLAYVKANTNIFGTDADTENTILSVFRDNRGLL